MCRGPWVITALVAPFLIRPRSLAVYQSRSLRRSTCVFRPHIYLCGASYIASHSPVPVGKVCPPVCTHRSMTSAYIREGETSDWWKEEWRREMKDCLSEEYKCSLKIPFLPKKNETVKWRDAYRLENTPYPSPHSSSLPGLCLACAILLTNPLPSLPPSSLRYCWASLGGQCLC